MPKIEELQKALRANAWSTLRIYNEMYYANADKMEKWVRLKDCQDLFSAFQAEQEAKWQKLSELLKNRPSCEKCEVFTSDKTATSTARAIFCEGLRAVRVCPKDEWTEEVEKVFDDPATTEKTPAKETKQ